jgi:phosphoserine phosphatase
MHPAKLTLPLVVDLDGTLIKTDLLVESTNELLVANPLNAFKLISWIQGGRASLKSHLAEMSQIDSASLPYNKALVAWLDQQKALGRHIILATASHKLLADKVADHLGLFDEVLATEGNLNLKAANMIMLAMMSLTYRYGKALEGHM